jgi:ABC-type transport system involved in multi-copper enzyme maturation permease subunit
LPANAKIRQLVHDAAQIPLLGLTARFLLKRRPVKALLHEQSSPRPIVAISGVASLPFESTVSMRRERRGVFQSLTGTASSVWHTAVREVRAQLISPKGRLVLALFGLLGLLPSLLRTQIATDAGLGSTRDEILQNQQLVSLFGVSAATELSKCPTAVVAMGVATLLMLPFFVVLLAHDCISDDVERGVSRWVLTRASRPALFVGKLLGVWTALALLFLVLFSASFAMAAASPQIDAASAARWSARFWVICGVMCFPYLALTLFVSAASAPSTRALLLALGTLFCLSILRGFTQRISPWAGRVFFPGTYDSLLLSVEGAQVWVGAALAFAWGTAWVLAGMLVMSRREV